MLASATANWGGGGCEAASLSFLRSARDGAGGGPPAPSAFPDSALRMLSSASAAVLCLAEASDAIACAAAASSFTSSFVLAASVSKAFCFSSAALALSCAARIRALGKKGIWA